MAMTNRDRVGKALELLREGLAPYVERKMRSFFGPKAEAEVARLLGDDRLSAGKPLSQMDVAALLKVMWESWSDVFRKTLGFAERSLVSELREWRNRWAHQETFSSDDADRALDSAERLLAALSAPQAEEVRRLKLELRRQVYDEQVRSEKRRLGGSLIESSATSSLKPWREVAVPHPDVTSGRYQQAEFAADLWQVYLGEGSDEYRDPVEFFRRTYLTESLRQLLANAILRLTGQGGRPRGACRPISVGARRTPCWPSFIWLRGGCWRTCRAWSGRWRKPHDAWLGVRALLGTRASGPHKADETSAHPGWKTTNLVAYSRRA